MILERKCVNRLICVCILMSLLIFKRAKCLRRVYREARLRDEDQITSIPTTALYSETESVFSKNNTEHNTHNVTTETLKESVNDTRTSSGEIEAEVSKEDFHVTTSVGLVPSSVTAPETISVSTDSEINFIENITELHTDAHTNTTLKSETETMFYISNRENDTLNGDNLSTVDLSAPMSSTVTSEGNTGISTEHKTSSDIFTTTNALCRFQLGTSCYEVIHKPYTWYDARATCRDRNDDLVTINSQNEQEYLATIVDRYNISVWIGLRLDENRDYVWPNRDRLTFSAWDAHEPDGLRGSCVSFSGENAHMWVSAACWVKKSTICEYNSSIFIPFSQTEGTDANTTLSQDEGGGISTSVMRAVSAATLPTDVQTVKTKAENYGDGGISGGGVAGVVIGCTLLLAVAAAAVLYTSGNRANCWKPKPVTGEAYGFDNILYDPKTEAKNVVTMEELKALNDDSYDDISLEEGQEHQI